MFKWIYDTFLGIWEPAEGLNQRAVRSSAILYVGKVVTKAVAFVRTIIIARLLFPQDIGLFGLGGLAVSTTGIFFQSGSGSSIVQEPGEVEKYLNSTWTFDLLLNVLLFLVIFFLSSPLAVLFFHNAAVGPIVKALSFMLLIEGFQNAGINLLSRDLKFAALFAYDTISYVLQLVVTIALAFWLRNYWALVYGAIVGKVFYLISSYVFSPYRPKFDFNISGAKHLFKYGRWITLTGIVLFFVNQGDNITIGRVLNANSLAYYQLAFSLGTLPATEIVGVLSGLLFPLYANLQQDFERLRSVFKRVSRMAFAISIPASVGLMVLAKPIVTVVYGVRWLPMVPILQVIVIYGLIKAFELITEPLFRGIGKPHISTATVVAQFMVMFSLIIPFTQWYGPVGTAWAVFCGFITAQVIFFYQLRKNLGLGLGLIWEVSALPIAASLVMGVLLWYLKSIFILGAKSELFALMGIGIVTYGSVLLLLDGFTHRNYFQSLVWIKNNL